MIAMTCLSITGSWWKLCAKVVLLSVFRIPCTSSCLAETSFWSRFFGQPRKYAEPRRLPGLEVKISYIQGVGLGLFLCQKVYAGQTGAFSQSKSLCWPHNHPVSSKDNIGISFGSYSEEIQGTGIFMNQFQPQYQIDSRTVLKGKSLPSLLIILNLW